MLVTLVLDTELWWVVGKAKTVLRYPTRKYK